jgi:DNA polymerase-3 subunit delta
LVLCCNKLDKRRKVSKTLVKKAVRVDCSRITWQDARKWSVQYTRQNDKKLDGAAASALVKAVGPNLTALKNELDKLILHAGERGIITLDDIEELVPNSRERSIFELSDAIAAGNVRDAVELGEQLLLRGEAPEAIIGFLSMRIRTLWQVKRLASEGRSERQIASDLSIPPFAARKASQTTRKLADNWFMDKLHLLAEADHELKSTSLPSRARPTWLAQFLASLCRKE